MGFFKSPFNGLFKNIKNSLRNSQSCTSKQKFILTNIILCWKIAISPQPNIRFTRDQSVNSSLSIVVQQKKTRALYQSRFDHGGPTKFEDTFFKKIIFVDFRQNDKFFKNLSGDEFKSQRPHVLDSSHLHTYQKTEFSKYDQHFSSCWSLIDPLRYL